jgi:sec-independent protein translocase protein TatA
LARSEVGFFDAGGIRAYHQLQLSIWGLFMFGGKLGLPELLVLLVIALLIFGPGKLADFGKGLGEGIKNFKSAVKDGEQAQGTEEKK